MNTGQQHRFRDAVFGPPRDPLAPETRKHIALIALLAWIGIGADGLSSSAYGPAEAFIALGTHSQLALYLAVVGLLIYLNLRGVRESILVLAPIFVGFVITHFALIGYGIWAHQYALSEEVRQTVQETHDLAGQTGWFFVLALFLKAYSLGGGTYTGIEAVSNNVNMLKEPRVRTGKWTMFLMAFSLSVTAAGIILLYLLWDVAPSHTGQTLNAVVFGDIIDSLGLCSATSHTILTVVLVFEGALLFVAANTGFLGGPSVLANMAVDRWVPNQFSALSSRLVTRNGVLLMGAAALAILVWTEGYVSLLVVLYTVNVFITFTLALWGLTIHWWRQRRDVPHAKRRLALAGFALLITASILVVIIVERFLQGGIVTLAITSSVVLVGIAIRRHYSRVRKLATQLERGLRWKRQELVGEPPPLRPEEPTAVFLVSAHRGLGLHTVERVESLFPGHFRNFVFVSVGTVDSESFGSEQSLITLQYETRAALDGLVNYAHVHGKGSRWFDAYGADRLEELEGLSLAVREAFPNSVFFTNRLVFAKEHWWSRLLHNGTPLAMQRLLNLHGLELVILPVMLHENGNGAVTPGPA